MNTAAPGDVGALDQVALDEPAALGALAAHGEGAVGEDEVAQLGEGSGEVELEVLGPTRVRRTRPPRRSATARPLAPAATPDAATVNAWLARSGSSAPAVHLITRVRMVRP